MRHFVNYKHLNTLLADNHSQQSMPTSSQQASGLLVLPALLVAALVSLPIIVTLLSLAQPAGPIWDHLRDTVLNEYLLNTLALMMLTGGYPCSWVSAPAGSLVPASLVGEPP